MNLLILTDIQGHRPALDAVLSTDAARTADAVVCLGDVASGPQPRDVIERIRALDAIVVRGNMDEVIARGSASMTDAGSDPGSADAQRFADIDAWCTQRITESDRAWLADLPLTAEVDLGHGRRLLACHGSPRSNEDVIDSETPEAEVVDLLGGIRADIVAVGHMHTQMLRQVRGTKVVHPGSVGWPAPAPDGLRRPHAEFAIVTSLDAGLEIVFCRVVYRVSQLQNALETSEMPHASWYAQLWRDAESI